MSWTLAGKELRMPLAPKVTVLMSFHNDEDFLYDAIASILNQTFRDFEFLIIDDGSTDKSLDIALSIKDSRIRLHRNLQNQGLTKSLAWGINQSKGKYIARMDADDLSKPERLAKQVDFLDNNPTVGIVGSTCELIDTEGHFRGLYPVPHRNTEIRWASFLANPFAHPTVMLRKSILVNHQLTYNPRLPVAQDYDLWVRLLEHTDGYNFLEPLLSYRLRPGITQKKRKLQLEIHDKIALQKIDKCFPGLHWTLAEVGELRRYLTGKDEISDLNTHERSNIFRVAHNYLVLFEQFSRLESDKKQRSLKALVNARVIGFSSLEETLLEKTVYLLKLILIRPYLASTLLDKMFNRIKRIFSCGYESFTSLFE